MFSEGDTRHINTDVPQALPIFASRSITKFKVVHASCRGAKNVVHVEVCYAIE